MSQRKRIKLPKELPGRIRAALHRYSKGAVHTLPDLSCLSDTARQTAMGNAWRSRLERLHRILMKGGRFHLAVQWPEYDWLVAELRARDLAIACKSEQLNRDEQQYVAGKVSEIGLYELYYPIPERVAVIAARRASFVRSSLTGGSLSQFDHADVQTHLLKNLHPKQEEKVLQIIARLNRIQPFNHDGKTRRDQRLRAKHDRCVTSLRRCWREIFAHPATYNLFRAGLEQWIGGYDSSLLRIA